MIDTFGPSQNPTQTIAGMSNQAPPPNPLMPEGDDDMAIRLMYSIYPHPALGRLIDE